MGLCSAFFELVIGCVGSCELDEPGNEFCTMLDEIANAKNLRELAIKMLDFWYMVKLDILTSWNAILQQQWLRLCFAVKYGDVQKVPGQLALTVCGLLLELANHCPDIPNFDAWRKSVHCLAGQTLESPPPAGWTFPAFKIYLEFVGGSAQYGLARSGDKGKPRTSGAEVYAASGSGPKICVLRKAILLETEVSEREPCKYIAKFEDLVPSTSIQEKCQMKTDKLFMQKTRPVRFYNQASSQLKICLFKEGDMFCAFPLGGVGGPCVITLDPGRRALLRPPSSAERFQMKVLAPGVIGMTDKFLYGSNVARGQSIELRSRDCSIE